MRVVLFFCDFIGLASEICLYSDKPNKKKWITVLLSPLKLDNCVTVLFRCFAKDKMFLPLILSEGTKPSLLCYC